MEREEQFGLDETFQIYEPVNDADMATFGRLEEMAVYEAVTWIDLLSAQDLMQSYYNSEMLSYQVKEFVAEEAIVKDVALVDGEYCTPVSVDSGSVHSVDEEASMTESSDHLRIVDNTVGLTTSMEEYKHDFDMLGWNGKCRGGSRNNVKSHQTERYLDRSMRLLQSCGWWDQVLFAECLRQAEVRYEDFCRSGLGMTLKKNKHRDFLKCVMKLYCGVDARMIRLVVRGGMNGLSPESAKYFLALLLFVECIPTEQRQCVLEQYWIVASIGDNDPELKLFAC
eukprot:TRINITY_DN1645_c0_g1_i1.p1 TRINITY_DN1645_c0_g1~~TRINITY_DN1645_c0_g1_i1.p1  ORF type:complete len:282 (-),score=60.13 TRINITY_DN1645_c0_g1_i1:193-1038(-)